MVDECVYETSSRVRRVGKTNKAGKVEGRDGSELGHRKQTNEMQPCWATNQFSVHVPSGVNLSFNHTSLVLDSTLVAFFLS